MKSPSLTFRKERGMYVPYWMGKRFLFGDQRFSVADIYTIMYGFADFRSVYPIYWAFQSIATLDTLNGCLSGSEPHIVA